MISGSPTCTLQFSINARLSVMDSFVEVESSYESSMDAIAVRFDDLMMMSSSHVLDYL